jgi:hypothetical protein
MDPAFFFVVKFHNLEILFFKLARDQCFSGYMIANFRLFLGPELPNILHQLSVGTQKGP